MPTNWKDTSYDLILVVVDWLIKMVHSNLARMIDTSKLAEIIPDIITRYYNLPDSTIKAQLSPYSFGLLYIVCCLDVK